MIEVKDIVKRFNDVTAIDKVNFSIQENTVFGLLGTNGAGKSTLLRMAAGIIKPDEGSIMIDGEAVWDNLAAKKQIFYISDDQFYFQNGNAEEIAAYYSSYYDGFETEKFKDYLKRFDLDSRRKMKTFSKGMKKQISILLGICSNVKYLLCDETFDGLDPVMRQGIKSIFLQEMELRPLTPIIASHNLRELEDICDYIGVLHRGGVILAKDLIELKGDFLKIQCVLPENQENDLKRNLDIIKINRHGKLLTMTVRGEAEMILPVIEKKNPVYCEAFPLSLEEIFISEMEAVGYDIKALIC